MPVADEPLERELFRILDILQRAGIRHFATGALARNLYGESRTSRDFDIVLDAARPEPEDLRKLFEREGYVVEGPLRGDLGERLVLHFANYYADLWLSPKTELSRQEFERFRHVPYAGRTIPVIHPEDYVLRKLVNYYRVRRKPNDIDDAHQVLLYEWENIDRERLVQRAIVYRIEKKARELIAIVEEDRARDRTGP